MLDDRVRERWPGSGNFPSRGGNAANDHDLADFYLRKRNENVSLNHDIDEVKSIQVETGSVIEGVLPRDYSERNTPTNTAAAVPLPLEIEDVEAALIHQTSGAESSDPSAPGGRLGSSSGHRGGGRKRLNGLHVGHQHPLHPPRNLKQRLLQSLRFRPQPRVFLRNNAAEGTPKGAGSSALQVSTASNSGVTTAHNLSTNKNGLGLLQATRRASSSSSSSTAERLYRKLLQDRSWVLVLSEEEVLALDEPVLPPESGEKTMAWDRFFSPTTSTSQSLDFQTDLRQLVYQYGVPSQYRDVMWWYFTSSSSSPKKQHASTGQQFSRMQLLLDEEEEAEISRDATTEDPSTRDANALARKNDPSSSCIIEKYYEHLLLLARASSSPIPSPITPIAAYEMKLNTSREQDLRGLEDEIQNLIAEHGDIRDDGDNAHQATLLSALEEQAESSLVTTPVGSHSEGTPRSLSARSLDATSMQNCDGSDVAFEEQQHQERGLPEYVLRQIEVDIPRTLPKALTSADQKNALRNILQAYCVHNPKDAYCQSMNVIAGLLVFLGYGGSSESSSSSSSFSTVTVVAQSESATPIDERTSKEISCSEPHTFILFLRILRQLTPLYHTTNLRGLLVDLQVLEKLLQELCPKFLTKIQSVGLDVLFFAVDPFLCLFGHTLPMPALVRVWDVILLEGDVGLFGVFIACCALVTGQHEAPSGEREQLLELSSKNQNLSTCSSSSSGAGKAKNPASGAGTSSQSAPQQSTTSRSTSSIFAKSSTTSSRSRKNETEHEKKPTRINPAAPEVIINKWTRDVRELASVDIDAILVKTRAYLETGAITREKLALLRRQDPSYDNELRFTVH
ncbi:unnamed protein product [Amoebophrya sp. A25]|nr:unnamed protein product [Amoebophrya sp. A25]|eukprot:GSA25T00017884001.1